MNLANTTPFWLHANLIDPLEGTIQQSSGEVLHLQKKPMEVLQVLVASHGRVVPGDLIIEAVWGQTSGGDEGLKRCIHAIRKALGDSGPHPSIIRTVRGRGYACEPAPDFRREQAPAHRNQQPAVRVERRADVVHSRQVTAVSIILSVADTADAPGDLQVPPDLMSDLLEQVKSFAAACAYELGVFSTILFGLDTTRDDDQLAAVELAKSIRDGTRRHKPFQVRIGIATSDEPDFTLLEYPQTTATLRTTVIQSATALAAAADYGVIGLCETTREICSRFIDVHQINQSVCESARIPAERRTQPRPAPVKLVGREVESSALINCWQRASGGDGVVAFVSGEAGIGKSTLCESFIRKVPSSVREAAIQSVCQSRNSHIPLHPILVAIRRSLNLDNLQDSREKAHLVGDRISELGFTDPAAIAVITEFFQLDDGAWKLTNNPPAGVRRNMLLEILSRLLLPVHEMPHLIVIDDIQWADSTTLELLDRLVEKGPLPYTMILVIARSECRPSWINRSHVVHINVSPIEKALAQEIVQRLDEHSSLGMEAIHQILDHAAGNPLFIEEATRSVLSGPRAEVGLDEILSKSIRHLLAAKVDALGKEKSILVYASIVGNQFNLDQLRLLMQIRSGEIEEGLAKLGSANMIHLVSLYPTPTYRFDHSLLQAAVYRSIPSNTLKRAHGVLAELIESSEEPYDKNFLAFHCEASEQYEKAAVYWMQSANRAKINSLFAEAVQHYENAVNALLKSRWSSRRDELELQLRIEYGPVLMSQKGYAHRLVKDNYQFAEKLTADLVDTDSQYPPQALFGLWSYRVVNGDLHEARVIGETLLELALDFANDELELEANVLLGVTQTHLGDYEDAINRLERTLVLYDHKAHAHHKHFFGQDPCMAANIYTGLALAQLGRLEESAQFLMAGLIAARRSEHPNSLCFALVVSARISMAAGELDTMLFRAKEAYALAEASDFPLWRAAAQFLIHTHEYLLTRARSSVDKMLDSLEQCRQLGNALSYLDYASTAAHALLDLQDLEAAKRLVLAAKTELERRITCSDEMAVKVVEARLLELLKKSGKPLVCQELPLSVPELPD